METEVQRIERRLQEWMLQAARNKEARETKRSSIDQKREEAARFETEHARDREPLDELQAELVSCAAARRAAAGGRSGNR